MEELELLEEETEKAPKDKAEREDRFDRKDAVRGPVHFYMLWPFILIPFLAGLNVWIYLIRVPAGIVMSAFILIYTIVVAVLYFYNRNKVAAELIAFARRFGYAQSELVRNMSTPYTVIFPNGRILWMNRAFMRLLDPSVKAKPGRALVTVFPELGSTLFPLPDSDRKITHVSHGDRQYRVEIVLVDETKVKLPGISEKKTSPDGFYAIYLFDETDLVRYVRENAEERLVTGLIYIDNFDEIMDQVEESRQSLLVALADQKITRFFAKVDGIAKKMETDKYFVIFKEKYYHDLKRDGFTILDDVKTINVGNEIPLTISIGLGLQGKNYNEEYGFARAAIDMALGRGGDQVVVKNQDQTIYFGGKSAGNARATKVRARVKAESLRDFMIHSGNIIVMGHQMADVDCFGAFMGINRIAKTLGKELHILLNDVNISTKPLLDRFRESRDYSERLFIGRETALDMARDQDTLVIVVDTNRASRVECEELLHMGRDIVLFDHHRQSEDSITGTSLSYVEPFASSTCEMIAEVMQYIDTELKMTPLEADSLYAGIIIDTNNFLTKTGVRTFEAAAYLRRCGADVIRVRKLFRDSKDSYQARAEVVRRAQIYRDHFAISTFPDLDVDSPTIIGAQAANELLNIEGIQASFVLTEYKGKIYVSARSIDEVNVQLIMEQMGGGGHMSTAGTQIQHTDMKEAVASLKMIIDRALEKGEIGETETGR